MNIEALRHAIVEGKLEWRRHALEQMANRAISRDGVLQVIFSGEIIEDYPKDNPFPSLVHFYWDGSSSSPFMSYVLMTNKKTGLL